MPLAQEPRKIPLIFFRTQLNEEPVRDWLRGLSQTDRRAIGSDLLKAQWRWPVAMPLCRPMGKGMWEVRTNLPNNRTARVFISHHEGHLVALHGYMKKTRATPDEDLGLARKRQRELKP